MRVPASATVRTPKTIKRVRTSQPGIPKKVPSSELEEELLEEKRDGLNALNDKSREFEEMCINGKLL